MDVDPAAAGAVDYPQMFRRMIVRSAEAALASVDPQAADLQEDVRERGLYTLGLALELPEAWPASRELLLSLSQPLGWQGYLEQCVVLLGRAIALAENLADSAALAKLHLQLGWCYWKLGQFDQAQGQLMNGYQLAQQQLDPATQVDALDLLSAVAAERSDLAGIKGFVDEIFKLTRTDDPRRAHGYARLGSAALWQGEWEDAVRWFAEAIQRYTSSDQHRFAGQAERNVALAYTYAGQYQLALTHYQIALDTFARYPSKLDTAQTQLEIGVLHWRQQNHPAAIAMFQLCEPVFARSGDSIALVHLYNNYGLAYTGIGSFEDAERCFSRSLELARSLNMPLQIANVLESLGGMYCTKGMLDMAVATWEQGLTELADLPDPPQYLRALLARRILEARNAHGESVLDSPCTNGR